MKRITTALTITALSFSMICLTGCNSSKKAASESGNDTTPAFNYQPYEGPGLFEGGSVQTLPKAIIYKTNGDYNNNVAVTLNNSRTAIVSYPSPTDVSEKSAPVELEEGWLLDRRGGIGKNTAFLRYTYKEYSALKQAPSPSQLMEEIIPEARVTASRALDISASQAIAQPSLVDSILSHEAKPKLLQQK